MKHPAFAIVPIVLLAVLALPFALAAYRMVKGPGYADRFVALDMLTAVTVCFSALTALSTGRSAFLDIGLGIVLINFVSTCAAAAFLERKGHRR
jgi:multicomponent Na+:H+ antiporter subunit F